MASAHNVAFIEMPPYASADDSRITFDDRAAPGRLDDSRDWFATTPVIVLLQNGIVRDAAEGQSVLGMLVDWGKMKFVPAQTAR
jgi:hypothetical protein